MQSASFCFTWLTFVQISDVSFQRYVLIQVLIVMDFLLSLSKKAKEKLASATLASANKSVIYADIAISDEDASALESFSRPQLMQSR